MAHVNPLRNTKNWAVGRLCSVALVAFAAGLLTVSCSEPVAPRKADDGTTTPPPVVPPTPTPTPPPTSDTSPPTTPASLVATTDGPFGITVSWQASSDNVGVSGYRVERCAGAPCTNFSQVGTSGGTSFSD